MSTLVTTNPTLLDLANRSDANGKVVTDIVEILNQTNEILDDMTFVEGNLPTGHKTTVRTGIPTPTWRKLYGGVQPAKSTTAQVIDSCGMLEAYAEVDVALADLNGNSAAWRLSEEKPFIEGLNQEFVKTLFYGNETTQPEAFTGLAPRFNSLTASTAQSADNVLTAGGASNCASIWLVVWSPNTVHGIIPKGSRAGIQVQDKGQVTIEDATGSSGGRYEAYRTHYRFDVGLSVRDWRYVVRIPNIDVTALTKNAATGADLIDLLTQALEQIPNLKAGRPVFYANRKVRSFLRRQIANKIVNSTLQMDTVAGKQVLTFDGVPFRRCDQLLNTETAVS